MLKQNFKKILLSVCTVSLFVACNNDDDVTPPVDPTPAMAEFTVTIENVIPAKDYLSSGATGLIIPGATSEAYTFNAGKGTYLSFATMYVQSNDLFFAPDEHGIALYNEDGTAVTGDVTASVKLWDAGTEVNEEPGTGPNQPMRGGPNTGMDENGMVKLISEVNDDFTYPAVNTAIKVMLAHDGGTQFTLTIENLTDDLTLPSPFAPGVWVLNSAEQTPIFTAGEAASEGLEDIAEDGANAVSIAELEMKTGYVSPYAPGAYAVGDDNTIFTDGSPASDALEGLAEDGNAGGFMNVFNTPMGASEPGPIFPGGKYSFTFNGTEGDKLSFATMLVQSNDWFIGADQIELFNNGTAISGEITSMVELYDAGTEVDEYAGAGNNQPVRQAGANTGEDENGNVVEETEAGMHVPAVAGLIKVTITSN